MKHNARLLTVGKLQVAARELVEIRGLCQQVLSHLPEGDALTRINSALLRLAELEVDLETAIRFISLSATVGSDDGNQRIDNQV